MKIIMNDQSRRQFIRVGMVAAAMAALPSSPAAPRKAPPIALFEKPLQFLSYRELGEILAEIGFDGVEATIRRGGHISPERAVDELPEYVEGMKASGLEVLVMATSVTAADEPHSPELLQTAAKLGIKRYRLGGFGYNPPTPIFKRLDDIKSRWQELAALNRELGITGLYQNHAGSKNVGGPIWDLHYLLKDISPAELGVAYDIRHAMVEGSSAWPISWQMIRPWVGAYYVKDFVFDGARARNVPMGKGIVGTKFYDELKRIGVPSPVSLHVPHLRTVKRANLNAAIGVIRNDFRVLKSLLS